MLPTVEPEKIMQAMATTLSGPTLRAEADQWCLNKLPDLQKYSLVIHARELCKCLKSLWLQTRNLPTFMDTSSCSRVISRPVSRWPWTGLVYLFVFVFEGSNMLKLGMTIDLERVACTLVGRPDVDAAQGSFAGPRFHRRLLLVARASGAQLDPRPVRREQP